VTKTRVAVLASGVGTNAGALIYASRSPTARYDIALVSGDKPEAPALKLAELEGVPVIRQSTYDSADKQNWWALMDLNLRERGIEFIVLAGFMRIIPKEFIERWPEKILNIHPSLLPKYKGLDAHRQAIDNGDSHSGCSIHVVTPEVDDGPVIAQLRVAIDKDDTPETLAARVRMAEHQLLPQVVQEYIMRGHPNYSKVVLGAD
jgi:phosphoribosylglycinamide formyltransferase-1